MSKDSCGRMIPKGQFAADRWGRIICLDCDRSYPAPLMAVYTVGRLLQPVKCGMTYLSMSWPKCNHKGVKV